MNWKYFVEASVVVFNAQFFMNNSIICNLDVFYFIRAF